MERLWVYIMSTSFTKEDMTRMEAMLSSFLSANNIALSGPVDVFALATRLGFDVRAATLPGDMEGLIIVNEFSKKIKAFKTNKVIAYNIPSALTHTKFIVAHELAHYITEWNNQKEKAQKEKAPKIVVAARDHTIGYSTNIEEQEKDYIAAAILVPMEDLLRRFSLNLEDHSDKDKLYTEIADFYRVDIRLAERRVGEVSRVKGT